MFEEAYVHWIGRYIVFHGKKHPSTLGAPDMSAFLTWLAVERQVSASTQNQALSAVLLLYKAVLGPETGRASGSRSVSICASRISTSIAITSSCGRERAVRIG